MDAIMDPTAAQEAAVREMSATTVSRVERNDSTLGTLQVANDAADDCFWPNDSNDLSRIGNAIGKNTHLRRLFFHTTHELGDVMDTRDKALFLEALKRNTSIEALAFTQCNVLEGMASEILSEYTTRNSNLDTVALSDCPLGNGGAGAFASAVSRSTSLKGIVISDCSVDDDILGEFVSGISGMRQRLMVLSLEGNTFGRVGCDALAILLRDPICNICYLDLSTNNNIDDSCAIILADALKFTEKLKKINLSSNEAITAIGWGAFIKALCNTSSVNATYLSNHTLQAVTSRRLPTDLSSLIELNNNGDEEEVAVQKILRYHSHLDMEPFLEWDLKVLPLAVSWFDRARGYVQNDDEVNSVDAKKLSSMYQFVRAVPLMFVPNAKKSGVKRKADETN